MTKAMTKKWYSRYNAYCETFNIIKMVLQVAIWFVIFSVTWAKPDLKSCKFFVDCKCGSSNDSYRFCINNTSDSEDYCKRFSGCSSILDRAHAYTECPEGIDDDNCKNGIRRNNSQTLYRIYEGRSFKERNRRSNSNDIKDCPDPGFIPNGIRQAMDGSNLSTPRTFLKGEFVIYACTSEEFSLQDKGFLVCSTNGTWSSPLPRCIRTSTSSKVTCRDPGYITNGDRYNMDGRVSNTVQRFEVGQSVLYVCNRGFALQPHSFITCTAEGKWSNSKPRCVLISLIPDSDAESVDEDHEESLAFCRDPGIDPNGDRTPRRPMLPRGFMQGARLEYFCYEGYILRGEEELFCLNTGKWSSVAPNCEAEDFLSTPCNNPGPVLNGIITARRITHGELQEIESAFEYAPGTRLDYSCDANHILEGNSLLVCGEYGTWSAQPPKCFPKCGVSYADATPAEGFSITEMNSSKEWPWAVGLSRNGNEHIICNAVLLNQNTVVTAANCVSELKTVFLYFGRLHRDVTAEDSDLIVRASSKVLLHPDFNDSKKFESDIALIKFAPKIRYTEKILPICLPTKESTEKNVRPGNVGYVAGFGDIAFRTLSKKLVFGRLPVLPAEDCRPFSAYYYFLLTDNHFCSGSRTEDYRATCVHEGSAFGFYDSENDSYTLEGIVLDRLCRMHLIIKGPSVPTGSYLVMTKVRNFLPWIHENLSD